jgi:hypothetical protein
MYYCLGCVIVASYRIWMLVLNIIAYFTAEKNGSIRLV